MIIQVSTIGLGLLVLCIRSFYEAANHGLLFNDLWPPCKNLSHRDVSIDVLHPNPAGHEVLAGSLLGFLLPLLSAQSIGARLGLAEKDAFLRQRTPGLDDA